MGTYTVFLGGGKRDRTADLLHAMQALSQLSYTPVPRKRAHYSEAMYACKAAVFQASSATIKLVRAIHYLGRCHVSNHEIRAYHGAGFGYTLCTASIFSSTSAAS